MIDIPLIATSAVMALVSLLAKAGEKGVEKAGEQVAATLFESLKKRLTPPAAKEAMDDLAKTPNDPDAQVALRLQLRKAMEADPTLAVFLEEVAKEQVGAGVTQVATVTGDQNKTIQIGGSHNSVG